MHLPILQVIIPMLAAPICLIINQTRMVWAFATIASALSWIISGMLCYQLIVSDADVISYALGGWDAPWGIEYRIDTLNAFVLLIVSSIATIVLCAAPRSIEKEIPEDKQPLFYVLFLLCMTGLLGITATGDVFNVFVFLEISSLSTYALIALGQDKRALTAAFKYLVVGTIGATFLLVGIGFLYSMTGTLNMQDLHQRLPEVAHTPTVIAAMAFIVVGICLKLALFPLHFWLPNAYAFAPSIATAFLAASSTKVAVYLLIRFAYSVFGSDYMFDSLSIAPIFIALGLAGMVSGSLVAIYQHNIKRMLAYSSIAQIGYIIIGVGLISVTGLQATLLHLFNHALMKGALFLALAGIVFHLGRADMDSIKGLGKSMPWTMAAIVIGGLSLVGVPLTVGFISKWYLVLAAFEGGLWWLAILIVLGSLLTLTYVWRIIEAAYFSPSDDNNAQVREAPLSILIPCWFLVIANIWLGVDTRIPVTLSEYAASYLFGVSL